MTPSLVGACCETTLMGREGPMSGNRILRQTGQEATLSMPIRAEGGERMPIDLVCPICEATKDRSGRQIGVNSSGNGEIQGIVTCLADGHQMSFHLVRNTMRSASQELPLGTITSSLGIVPAGLVEDIREAQRALLFGAYKACAVMCRRALQLGLLDRRIKDAPLSRMLNEARKKYPNKIDDEVYSLAMSIKNLGDKGAHRREEVTRDQAYVAVLAAAKMLGVLFPTRKARTAKAKAGPTPAVPA